MSESKPEWPYVGAQAVEIHVGGWREAIYGTHEITKVGKRDITLSNDTKYRVSDLTRQGTARYGHGYKIFAPDDPRVQAIREESERQNRENKARSAVENWTRDRVDEEALEAIKALVETLEHDGAREAFQRVTKDF